MTGGVTATAIAAKGCSAKELKPNI
jgi:hypothetical protein